MHISFSPSVTSNRGPRRYVESRRRLSFTFVCRGVMCSFRPISYNYIFLLLLILFSVVWTTAFFPPFFVRSRRDRPTDWLSECLLPRLGIKYTYVAWLFGSFLFVHVWWSFSNFSFFNRTNQRTNPTSNPQTFFILLFSLSLSLSLSLSSHPSEEKNEGLLWEKKELNSTHSLSGVHDWWYLWSPIRLLLLLLLSVSVFIGKKFLRFSRINDRSKKTYLLLNEPS